MSGRATGIPAAGAEIAPLACEPVTRVQLAKYAAASGDWNPIHLDEPFAVSAGRPSVLAHGMLTMALLGRLVTGWAGAGSVRALSVRFRSVVYPGDALVCRGRVVTVRGEPGARLVDLSIWAEKPDGAIAAQGTAIVEWGRTPA